MKKIGKLFALVLALALALSLAACSSGGSNETQPPESEAPGTTQPAGDSTDAPTGDPEDPATDAPAGDPVTITVGATPVPHVEILEKVKEILAEQNITLEIKEFTDYVQPNNAVEDGSLDANYFQHITYMNQFNEENGTHLASVAEVHYEPFAIYGGKTTSLADLPDGAQVGVPNDATNEARALLLLAQEGLITLKDDTDIYATQLDIVENPKNIQIVELEAAQLTSRLPDLDVAVINGNYALDAGLTSADALAVETATGAAAEAYVNVLTVKEGRENDEAILALAKALQSEEVRSFIDEKYSGGVVALF